LACVAISVHFGGLEGLALAWMIATLTGGRDAFAGQSRPEENQRGSPSAGLSATNRASRALPLNGSQGI
jgi:hypothetical protein